MHRYIHIVGSVAKLTIWFSAGTRSRLYYLIWILMGGKIMLEVLAAQRSNLAPQKKLDLPPPALGKTKKKGWHWPPQQLTTNTFKTNYTYTAIIARYEV